MWQFPSCGTPSPRGPGYLLGYPPPHSLRTAPLADTYAPKKNRTIPGYDLLLGQPRFVFNGVTIHFGQNKSLPEEAKCKGV